MKRYVKAADELFDGQDETLEEYVKEPFDLNNREVQMLIAYWAEWKLSSSISKQVKNRLKREGKEIYFDDLSWSKDTIKVDVMVFDEDSGIDTPIDIFTCNLKFDDGPVESYDDVEYIIVQDIDDFLVYNELD